MGTHSSQVVLGILLIVLVGLVLSRLWTPTGPTVAELVEAALHGPTAREQTAAAVKLADFGPEALEGLRLVTAESVDPSVQAACLVGLAKLWDYESMDLFFELMEAGAPRVRGRAAHVVMRMTGRHRPYSATAPEADRLRLVSYMRQDWEQISAASPEDREELFRRLRESHESKVELPLAL